MSKEIKVVNCTAVELKNLIKESVKQELATLTNNNQQQNFLQELKFVIFYKLTHQPFGNGLKRRSYPATE